MLSKITLPIVTCHHGLTTAKAPGHVLHCKCATLADSVKLADYFNAKYYGVSVCPLSLCSASLVSAMRSDDEDEESMYIKPRFANYVDVVLRSDVDLEDMKEAGIYGSVYLNPTLANAGTKPPSSELDKLHNRAVEKNRLEKRMSGSTLRDDGEEHDEVGLIDGLKPCGWSARDSIEVTREWEESGVLRRSRKKGLFRRVFRKLSG